jgi:hypothetical protein
MCRAAERYSSTVRSISRIKPERGLVMAATEDRAVQLRKMVISL